MKMLTQERLKELLHYCPETGLFIWLCNTGAKNVEGTIAGSPNSHGHRQISIYHKRHFAHRLAFLFMNGELPSEFVDHINGNPDDNRWTNLRAASATQNQRNSKLRSDSSSGLKGTHWHEKAKKWNAKIRLNKKTISLGSYESPLEAHTAYCVAAHKYFGEFANFGQ